MEEKIIQKLGVGIAGTTKLQGTEQWFGIWDFLVAQIEICDFSLFGKKIIIKH